MLAFKIIEVNCPFLSLRNFLNCSHLTPLKVLLFLNISRWILRWAFFDSLVSLYHFFCCSIFSQRIWRFFDSLAIPHFTQMAQIQRGACVYCIICVIIIQIRKASTMYCRFYQSLVTYLGILLGLPLKFLWYCFLNTDDFFLFHFTTELSVQLLDVHPPIRRSIHPQGSCEAKELPSNDSYGQPALSQRICKVSFTLNNS